MNEGLEPRLPLIYGKNDGPYDMIVSKEEMVRQNLKNLLLTNPGERVMDPNFGVGIKSYLFETQDSFNPADLIQQTQLQVKKYIPGIKIENFNVRKNSDHEFSVSIFYSLLVQKSKNILSFQFKVTV